MTINDIKEAVDVGKTVHWKTDSYKVIKNKKGEYLIKSMVTGNLIYLTADDGITSSFKEEDFYVGQYETTLETCSNCMETHEIDNNKIVKCPTCGDRLVPCSSCDCLRDNTCSFSFDTGDCKIFPK